MYKMFPNFALMFYMYAFASFKKKKKQAKQTPLLAQGPLIVMSEKAKSCLASFATLHSTRVNF